MKDTFSFLQDHTAKIIFFVFIANVAYDDPTLYLYKRVIYSIFIYWSLYEVYNFYINTKNSPGNFEMPTYYNVYLPMVAIFICIALYKDFNNPNLKITTLLNNPLAFLSVCPLIYIMVGANTTDLEPLRKLFLFVTAVLIVVFALPIFGKVKYYQGYVCANALIPLFIITDKTKKVFYYVAFMLVFGLFFSYLSDYRIIALRIILFFSLVVGFGFIKTFTSLKVIFIALICIGLYQFVTNLEDFLNYFADLLGLHEFDVTDTRAFLFEELLGELKGWEFVFGRGFCGTYFSEYFLMILVKYQLLGDHYDRFSVEVGYLHLLLKGGHVWYFLFIAPLLYTSMKGIFQHYNDKRVLYISIYLFTELLLMFIENWLYYSFQFVLMFFLAGYTLRRMYENENLDNHSIVQPG